MIDLARFTFSTAELAFRCGYWLRPDAVLRPEPDSDYMKGGKVLHKALAALVNAPSTCVPPEDAQQRNMFGYAKVWLDPRIRAETGLRAEVAFAYDVSSRVGRELVDPEGLEGTRWYADPALRAKHGVAPTEICGRLDLVGPAVDVDRRRYARVRDFKFHWGPELVEARAQLELCALAVQSAWGVDYVEAIGVHVWADRELHEEPYVFTAKELESIAADVAQVAEGTAADAPANDGPWCKARRCDARAKCPATLEAVKAAFALVPAERLSLAHRDVTRPIASNDEGASRLVAADLLEKAAEALREEAKAWADEHGGIVQKDAKVFSSKTHPEEKPDLRVEGAVEVLRELQLDFAILESTSWAAITEVSSKAKADEVRERFRAIGAIKTTEKTVYMAREPKAAGVPRRKAS